MAGDPTNFGFQFLFNSSCWIDKIKLTGASLLWNKESIARVPIVRRKSQIRCSALTKAFSVAPAHKRQLKAALTQSERLNKPLLP